MSHQFCTPYMIISGENALPEAGGELAALGKRALIVSDETMRRLGNIARLEEVLAAAKITSAVFDGVNAEPTDLVVAEGVAKYRAEGCDFLIAIGGGSPIDAMKAIAMLSALGGAPADYFGIVVRGQLPPMVAIPTTAGTGSEATQFTIISDTATEVKMLLKGPCLLPDLAIVDPAFTATAPFALTAHTGLDALCHCVEAYTSRKAQPLSDTFALSAAKRIFQNLQTACENPGDTAARVQMALAATEAGIAFNNASVTLIHGMSRPIGAVFHIAHGLSNAMLMESCLLFARPGAEGRFAELARHCGLSAGDADEETAADAFFAALAGLVRALKIPTLAGYGIDAAEFAAQIPKMAADAEKSGSPANTLRAVSIPEMEALYRSLWQ